MVARRTVAKYRESLSIPAVKPTQTAGFDPTGLKERHYAAQSPDIMSKLLKPCVNL